MLMKGDINRLISENINPIFENAFDKIKSLEERLDALEATKAPSRSTRTTKKEVDKEE